MTALHCRPMVIGDLYHNLFAMFGYLAYSLDEVFPDAVAAMPPRGIGQTDLWLPLMLKPCPMCLCPSPVLIEKRAVADNLLFVRCPKCNTRSTPVNWGKEEWETPFENARDEALRNWNATASAVKSKIGALPDDRRRHKELLVAAILVEIASPLSMQHGPLTNLDDPLARAFALASHIMAFKEIPNG